MKTVIKIASTCFYLGYIPLASGTIGSLVGLLIYFTVEPFVWVYTLVIFLILILGFLVCKEAEHIFGCRDSPRIIIDEIAGMLISFYLVPVTTKVFFIGFLLFRLLDIFKPYPARQAEKLSLGRGVMLDDIVCGIYTNFTLQVFSRLTA